MSNYEPTVEGISSAHRPGDHKAISPRKIANGNLFCDDSVEQLFEQKRRDLDSALKNADPNDVISGKWIAEEGLEWQRRLQIHAPTVFETTFENYSSSPDTLFVDISAWFSGDPSVFCTYTPGNPPEFVSAGRVDAAPVIPHVQDNYEQGFPQINKRLYRFVRQHYSLSTGDPKTDSELINSVADELVDELTRGVNKVRPYIEDFNASAAKVVQEAVAERAEQIRGLDITFSQLNGEVTNWQPIAA